MHTGLLWFGNSGKTLEEKIAPALDYYRNRYHKTPNLCFMHPSELSIALQIITVNGEPLILKAYRPVLPGHIWLGIGDEKETNELKKKLGIK